MRLKLKNLTALFGMFCLSQAITYGAPMTLNYDGQSHMYDKEPISLYVNNQLVESSMMPPVQIEGYVLVPTREVFNAMGAAVQWRSEEKKVYIQEQGLLIVLEVGSNTAWVNGEARVMDMMPKIINDKVLVPIRFISETLGFNVDWLGVERCVYISRSDNDENGYLNEEIGTAEEMSGLPSDSINQGTAANALNEKFPYLSYDAEANALILDEQLQLRADDISIEDEYTKNKMILTLNNGDFSEVTEGSWQGTEGCLKSIVVKKAGNGIQITVENNTLCTAILSQENGKAVVSFVKPREKYDKIIVIDAGHGGSDNGTSAYGMNEKDLTLAYGQALYELLEKDENIKVYATRNSDLYATPGDGTVGKQYPTLDMRVDLSNEAAPDLYISIHINSYSNPAPNGIETYYYTSSDNRGETFANMVQKALIQQFGMTDRRAKHGDLKVIRETNDPAVLIEAGFISNEDDYRILTAPDYAGRFAQTVYQCILDYYALGLN